MSSRALLGVILVGASAAVAGADLIVYQNTTNLVLNRRDSVFGPPTGPIRTLDVRLASAAQVTVAAGGETPAPGAFLVQNFTPLFGFDPIKGELIANGVQFAGLPQVRINDGGNPSFLVSPLRAFVPGDTIGPDAFSVTGSVFYAKLNGVAGSDRTFTIGPYTGLRIGDNYGYVKWAQNGYGGLASLTPVEWGFETTPGMSITLPIPTPGVGVVALGAAWSAARRRR